MKIFILICFLLPFAPAGLAQNGCSFDANITPGNINLPSQLKTNEKKTVIVRVENIGSCSWKKPDVTLKVKIVRGPSGSPVQRDELVPDSPITADDGDLEPGKWTSFRYEIEGPDYAGDYTLEFTLQVKGKPFGDLERKSIKIVKSR